MTPDAVQPPSNARWDRSFFGHPRGLSTLFFTEMWERFSYYGMRAILILFMTAGVEHGGLGFPTSKAGSIYGLYTAMVFLMSMPGGWIADRILGPRRAVFLGGIIIAAGHFSMAIPTLGSFYLGLGLIVIGTGLLKPNMSTMVGGLYSLEDARRDAGFSIFYMGINLGAFLSPLVCGYLGENINWHYGFSAAGVGMTLGLIQYAFGAKYLGSAGLAVQGTAADRRLFGIVLGGLAILALAVTAAQYAGLFAITAEGLAGAFGAILTVSVVIFFAWLLTAKGYTTAERKRFWAILVLFITSSAFWGAYEQAGSTLNLFAERNTNLHAWDFPLWGLFRASYFQSFNSIMILALAPVFAWLWVALGTKNPSIPAKFVFGLVGVGAGFAILIPVASSTNASPWWLTVTYFLHTCGELCLSPVGLSATTKLAPARVAGLMMGVWFLSDSVGNYVGGMLASVYETFPLPQLFGWVAVFAGLFGLLLLVILKPMKNLMGGVN
ncbi:MAG TPA: peptide MFS transporter [Bryobacteraceae bacterium]|nr:peptide MFS transporter [Bryobacteraceae bacterium]